MSWKQGRVLENIWREVVINYREKDWGVTEQFSHPTPKIRFHTNSTSAGLPSWQGCEHPWHQWRFSRHTEVAFESRVEALELLKLPGLVGEKSKVTTNRPSIHWCDDVCESSTFLKCFYFLNFSVLHICNLVERITKDETCTTQNYLWSAGSWVRVLHSLMPSELH